MINKNESKFKWWIIISTFTYIISLAVIMYFDVQDDGHFMMSTNCVGLNADMSIGPAAIHWILFVIFALIGLIFATLIPPGLGLLLVPGPLWILYNLVNFILALVANLIWTILELVFYILFGWVEYVFY